MAPTKPRRLSRSDGSHSGVFTTMKRTCPSSIFYLSTDQINSWFCFHVGRPAALALKDVAIECAQDPFVRLLAALCKTITRSTEEIYGQRHESLLHMWKVAKSIARDLRGHETLLKQSFGFGLDAGPQAGSLGVCQIIFITCKLRLHGTRP